MDSLKVLLVGMVAFSLSGLAAAGKETTKNGATKTPPHSTAAPAPVTPTRTVNPTYSILADYQTENNNRGARTLASGNADADLQHYQNLSRRLGVDLGFMIPMQSFSSVANTCPMLGLHFVWEAIQPFSFTVNYRRASADNKTTPGTGKLSVNYISMGAQASFASGRFVPFVKIEGGLYFNDFRDNAVTITGDDALLTTVGASAGIGFDFVVGREVSVGFDAMYHYAVPRNVSRSAGGNFNLGSSFATVGFRINF